jgi:hypothetical protein
VAGGTSPCRRSWPSPSPSSRTPGWGWPCLALVSTWPLLVPTSAPTPLIAPVAPCGPAPGNRHHLPGPHLAKPVIKLTPVTSVQDCSWRCSRGSSRAATAPPATPWSSASSPAPPSWLPRPSPSASAGRSCASPLSR